MEIAGEDGSRIPIKPESETVFGRGSGFYKADRTVSRRHVLFSLIESESESESRTLTESRVSFEVIGKNPIWVRSREGGEVRVFRRLEKGEVADGDWMCFGGQSPVWFALKKIEFEEQEEEESEIVESSGDLENVDVSIIDPVKEFGFLVIGHEFDHYPKQRIRDIRNWDWFLEEPRKDSDDDDEVFDKRRKSDRRRKRGINKGNDDDDWTCESKEDKELIAKVRKVQRPKYSTRSKDPEKPKKGAKNRSWVQKSAVSAKGEESEDEEDPTLGGFIVDDVDEEEESDVDEEEEEELDEDED